MINLRDSYAKVTWDLGSKHMGAEPWGKTDDTGRGIIVTIVQNNLIVTPTTEVLRMSFLKPDGTDGYITATLEGGKYYIETMSQVFAVPGVVNAELELDDGTEFIKSITFKIIVFKSQQSSQIISSNDYTALQEAIAEVRALDTTYAPRLNSVESQLADTMNKTSVTLTHIFADNTARDTYFTANPLEKKELTFIKVGTSYQQLINNTWTSTNPILVEAVNQIDDANTGTTKTLSASKELALLALKADKKIENRVFPSILNGWASVNNINYYKTTAETVRIYGRVGNGIKNIGTIIFTLPNGYKPLTDMTLTAVTYSSLADISTMLLTIKLNGDVEISSTAKTYLIIDLEIRVG